MRIDGNPDTVVKIEEHPAIFEDNGMELKMKEFGRATILQLSYFGSSTKFNKIKERK